MEQTEISLSEVMYKIPEAQRQAVIEQWKDDVVETAKGKLKIKSPLIVVFSV